MQSLRPGREWLPPVDVSAVDGAAGEALEGQIGEGGKADALAGDDWPWISRNYLIS